MPGGDSDLMGGSALALDRLSLVAQSYLEIDGLNPALEDLVFS